MSATVHCLKSSLLHRTSMPQIQCLAHCGIVKVACSQTQHQPLAQCLLRNTIQSRYVVTCQYTAHNQFSSDVLVRCELGKQQGHSLICLQVRREVVALVDAHPGALRFSHFDEGVMCHLQRRPETLVAAALREIARRTDLPGATNKSAYLTHWLMRFADDPSIPSLAGSILSA